MAHLGLDCNPDVSIFVDVLTVVLIFIDMYQIFSIFCMENTRFNHSMGQITFRKESDKVNIRTSEGVGFCQFLCMVRAVF